MGEAMLLYGLAAVISSFLFIAGVLNRRSGWKRKRSDLVADNLMLLAQMNAQMRHGVPDGRTGPEEPPATQPDSGVATASLAALGSAVQDWDTVAPEPEPMAPKVVTKM